MALLLTVRRPENPVGWLLGATMIVLTLLNFGPDYQYHTLYGGDLPAALLVPLELASNLGWAAGFPILLVAIPLVFPDGRLLSRRWRIVMWATAAVATLGVASAVFDPAPLGDAKHPVHNPLGVPGTHDVLSFLDAGVYTILLVLLMAATVVSLVLRYRRAGADLRRQLRWFIAGVTLAIVSMLGAFVTFFSPPSLVGLSIGFTALPVGIGIAVLKYRLYEIDVVINRTLLFATMASFITIVYVAIVVGVGSVVGGSGRASLFLSVLATAIVGVAFNPFSGERAGLPTGSCMANARRLTRSSRT